MNSQRPAFDDQTHCELLLAIQRYLEQGPCQQAAEVLRNEIEQRNLLPARFDFRGVAHNRSIADYERQVSWGQPSLVSLIERFGALVNQVTPPVIKGLPLRLFGSRRTGLNRDADSMKYSACVRDAANPRDTQALDRLDKISLLTARQLGRNLPLRHRLHKNSVEALELHCRILGHLSSVFCVAFDGTGRFIITGADDNLVKVWSATSGLLRFTLRGHAAEITDMTVSVDNTLLGTGSNDKTVRVWCLQNGECVKIFRTHTAMVTLISFVPFVDGDVRYLLSTGRDCMVNFYRYTASDHVFGPPKSFNERTTPGARLISSCHSPGGNLVVVGDTHHFIRIYRLDKGSVYKVQDIEAHTDKVDSLVWAHRGLRLASGSCDGLAKVWKFECNEWTSVVLDAKKKDDRPTSSVKNAYKVTMLCWSLEDERVVSSGSDHILRVWDWQTGNLIIKLQGHKDEAFVLTAHPIYKQFILSAGHDGFLMVWNIEDGSIVKRYQNYIETRGNLPIFDFAISHDGTLVAAVDSHGHLSILGVGSNQDAKMMPKEQFFHTDYMAVLLDVDSGFTIDEEMELAPHLLPPPNFVDADGVLYPDEIQRLVPGRASVDPDHMERLFEPIWLRRCMVDKLPKSTVDKVNDRLNALGEWEAEEIEREQKRVRQNTDKNQQSSTQNALPSERRKTKPTSIRRDRTWSTPGVPPDLNIDEPIELRWLNSSSDDSTYRTVDEDMDEAEEESLETTDSSDSDYCERQMPESSRTRRRRDDQEPGPSTSASNRDTPQRSSNRRTEARTRRRAVISSEDERLVLNQEMEGNSDVAVDEPGPSTSSSRRSANTNTTANGHARRRTQTRRGTPASTTSRSTASRMQSPATPSSRMTVQDESEPGPSSSARSRGGSNARSGQRATPSSKKVLDYPTWMRLVQPLKFPFVAQLDDEVVYFRQGHELYLQSVEQHNLYQITSKMRPLAELNAEEFCIVDEVKYSRKPFRLTTVRLARIDENGLRTGLVFSVKYHDMENVPDFIILRNLYDESVSRRYQPGDRIETILDNHWWTGTVDKKEAHDDEHYPRSNWYSLTVRWDTGEDEKMSPWDVQPLQGNRRSGDATEAEQLQFSAFPFSDTEWMGAVIGVDACCDRLLQALYQIEDEQDVRPFALPVNLEEYPQYSWNVDYPIDLQTIEQRARNKFYRRLRSCEQDIRYIAINASTFNEKGSVIVHNSRVLVETLIRYMRHAEYNDARALFDELKGLPENDLLEYNRSQRPDYSADGMRSHRGSIQERNEDTTVSNSTPNDEGGPEWITECNRVLSDLLTENSARHFMDRNANILEGVYDEGGCDDLNTILRNVQQKFYPSPLDVRSAVERLMQTCRSSLDNKRSPIYRDSLTFSGLFNSKMAPILAKWQRMQQSPLPVPTVVADSTTVWQEANNDFSAGTATSGSGHHLRNRRSRNAHVYNTRSRPELEPERGGGAENTGEESLNRGRAARARMGYYRNLNDGEYGQRMQEAAIRNSNRLHNRRSNTPQGNSTSQSNRRSLPISHRIARMSTTDSEQDTTPQSSHNLRGSIPRSTTSEDVNNASSLDDQPGPSNIMIRVKRTDGNESERMQLLESVEVDNTRHLDVEDTKDGLLSATDSSTLPENNGYRRSSRPRKRPACYESETEDDESSEGRNAPKRKPKPKAKPKLKPKPKSRSSQNRSASKRTQRKSESNQDGERSSDNGTESESESTVEKSEESGEGLEQRGERRSPQPDDSMMNQDDLDDPEEDLESSRDGENGTTRKRLRPRATQKVVNYCENESDEECVVYTTSVSTRGRLRRHRAFNGGD